MKRLYTPATLRPILIVACCALFGCLVAAAAAIVAAAPELTAPRIWKGYYTLLVKPSGDEATLARELGRKPGIEAVVSRHTAEVSFNTFGGFKSVTVGGMNGRLDPGDPRRDPYMEQLDALFHVRDASGEWEAFYLRTDLARLQILPVLSRALSGRAWAVADVSARLIVLRLALFLAFALVLALRSRSWSAAVPLGAALLPWVAAVALGTSTTVLICFLVAPLWAELLEGFKRRLSRRVSRAGAGRSPGRVPGLALLPRAGTAVLGLGAAALVVRTGTPLLPALLPVLSGILAFPLLYALEVLTTASRFHPVFEAVPILQRLVRRGPWLTSRRLWNCTLVGLALVALAAGGDRGGRAEPGHYAPAPIGGVREPLSWSGLEKLAVAGAHEALPNLASYLSHRAYQEALGFGRPYGLPSAGERVRISWYLQTGEGPEIRRSERVVKRFQESWVRETLAGAPPGSVERLLADQGYAALVLPAGGASRSEPASEAVVLGRHAWGLRFLAALAVVLFLVAYLLGRDFRLTPQALCVTTSLTLRRNQHPP